MARRRASVSASKKRDGGLRLLHEVEVAAAGVPRRERLEQGGQPALQRRRRLGVRHDAHAEQGERRVDRAERAVARRGGGRTRRRGGGPPPTAAASPSRGRRRAGARRSRPASTSASSRWSPMPGTGCSGSLWILISPAGGIAETMSSSGSSARSGARIVVVAEDRRLDHRETPPAQERRDVRQRPGPGGARNERGDLVRHRLDPGAPGGEDLLRPLPRPGQRAGVELGGPGGARSPSR